MNSIKKQFKLLFPLALLLLGLTNTRAQNYFGFHTENYSGVNGVTRNPASIADSRFAFDLNLIGASTVLSNNIFGAENFSDLFNENIIIPDDLSPNYQEDNFAYLNADILGPSFLININKKSTMALYSRVRFISNSVVNGSDIDQFLEDFDIKTDNFNLNQENATASLHGWGEIGLSYAQTLMNKGVHFLKGGITVKYLVGIGRGYGETNNLAISSTANGNDFLENFANSNINVAGNVSYGVSNTNSNWDDLELPKSFGFDLGFVYEYRPSIADYYLKNKKGKKILDPTKNKYKLRLGLSVTDIVGSINYKEGEEGIATVNTTTLDFLSDLYNAMDFQDIENTLNNPIFQDLINQTAEVPKFEDLVDQLQNATTLAEAEAILEQNEDIINDFEDINDLTILLNDFNIINTDSRTGIKASLPTAMHFDADWSFTKNLFLNLGVDFSLASRTNIRKNSIANEISLTPRYESRVFSIYSPVRVFQGQGTLWGLGVRLGPLYLGSGSLFTTLLSSNIRGVDAYAGIKAPILKKRNKDLDRDGIKNKIDKCPKIKGPIENEGCPWPDTDNDTVLDKDDACPGTTGDAKNKGCPWPDSDEDGVLDKNDKCPEEAGVVANNGCPEPKVTKKVQKELNSFAKSILFNTGKSTIKLESSLVLAEIIKILNEYPKSRFSIEGHTDSIGSESLNQRLSEKRAAAVEQFLIEKGIDSNRLVFVGYGEKRPIATNLYKAGRAQNRRVEINLVKE